MEAEFPKPRWLSLDRQAALVRLRHPGFETKLCGGQLVIRGVIHPTDVSDFYRIRVEYSWGKVPGVFVEAPELERNSNGEEPPHRHTDAEQPLCLFYPKHREWSGHDEIALTTIPWASEWLVYYEIWLATGEWKGGGVEHAPGAVRDAKLEAV